MTRYIPCHSRILGISSALRRPGMVRFTQPLSIRRHTHPHHAVCLRSFASRVNSQFQTIPTDLRPLRRHEIFRRVVRESTSWLPFKGWGCLE